MKYFNIHPILLALLIFCSFTSCNSLDKKSNKKKASVLFKYLKYPSGNIKEEYKYKNGILSNITYLDEAGTIDSLQTYHQGKLFSVIKYSYYEDGTINADSYTGNKLVVHLIFDSLMNLLYETPLDIPKVTHTTYKFRSGRTYFDRNKIDTIEIINNDIPPYNKGYSVIGANIHPINRFGTFLIQKFYQKKKTPDTLKLLLTAYQDINVEKPIGIKIDSIFIPVK